MLDLIGLILAAIFFMVSIYQVYGKNRRMYNQIDNDHMFKVFYKKLLGKEKSKGLLEDLKFIQGKIDELSKSDLKRLKSYLHSLEKQIGGKQFIGIIATLLIGLFWFMLREPTLEDLKGFILFVYPPILVFLFNSYYRFKLKVYLFKELVEISLEEKSNGRERIELN